MKVTSIAKGYVEAMDRLLAPALEGLEERLLLTMKGDERAYWEALSPERRQAALLEAYGLRVAERLRDAGFLQDHLATLTALLVEVWLAEEDSRAATVAGRVM